MKRLIARALRIYVTIDGNCEAATRRLHDAAVRCYVVQHTGGVPLVHAFTVGLN